MADQLKETKRTKLSMLEYSRAALLTIEHITKEATAVLWGQYCSETGSGQYCWNYNLGNVKHVRGDGYDYVSLKGVWEGVTPEQAAKLIASGQWAADPSPDHAKAVGPGKVSVIATNGNPATWFRAFDTLEAGMLAYVQFLNKPRWLPAWEAAMIGDYAGFSKKLHAGGYYTASEEVYTKHLGVFYGQFLASTEWERAISQLKDETIEIDDAPQPIIHPDVPLPEREDKEV